MTQDKVLICKDCGCEFISPPANRNSTRKGLYERAPECKPAARPENGGAQREMFTAVCSSCGGEAKVPFQPRDDRPVYCSDCFSRQR